MKQLLLLLVLLAGAISSCSALRARPTAVGKLKMAGRIRVCNAEKEEDGCTAKNCHFCSTDKVSVCLHTAQLAAIPSKGKLQCSANPAATKAAEKAVAARVKRNPSDPCEGLGQQQCDASDQCTWCKSAAVPSSCYTRAQAKFLPPAVFSCDKPAPSNRRPRDQQQQQKKSRQQKAKPAPQRA